MYLIAGLGNPGEKYSSTRHNIGYIMLDYLAAENTMAFTDSRWKGQVAKGIAWDESVVLLKPETFMNLSGMAVAKAADFYKLAPENIIVIHDDLDLDLGRVKMVAGGGDGGHKGIRSIIEHLGTRDFARIKIGIGRPPASFAPENYVLGKITADEKKILDAKTGLVVEGIRIFMQQGIAAAMTEMNRKQ
jgi:PTH1 family peptidyl-tRNA hydrolase